MREAITVQDRQQRIAEATAEITRFTTAQRLTRAIPVAVILVAVRLWPSGAAVRADISETDGHQRPGLEPTGSTKPPA